MAIMTVLITKMKKVVRLSHVHQLSLNVLILDNVYKKRTNVMAYWIATMAVMNWVVVSIKTFSCVNKN